MDDITQDEGAAPRRQSGRVRRKPTTFAGSPGTSKRKRAADGDDLDMDDASDDDDADSEEDEADEEEARDKKRQARKKRGPGKPASKKARPNGTAAAARGAIDLAIRPAGGARARKGVGRKRPRDEGAATVGGIYGEW